MSQWKSISNLSKGDKKYREFLVLDIASFKFMENTQSCYGESFAVAIKNKMFKEYTLMYT